MNPTNMAESLPLIIKIIESIGVTGLIVWIWWTDHRLIYKVLENYKRDMVEQREMYVKNVSLVKRYEELAGENIELVRQTITLLAKLLERVDSNMFCPMVRKEANRI